MPPDTGRPVCCDCLDARHVQPEDDAPLRGRGRVVHMNDGTFCPAYRFESAGDQIIARLGEYLDGDICGNKVVLDEVAHELKIGFAGGRKTDFNLLESQIDEGVPHAHFALGPHGFDQRLIAIAQVNRAPDGRCG